MNFPDKNITTGKPARSPGSRNQGPMDMVDRRMPGGRRALYIVVGLVLAALFIWWLWPSAQTTQRGGRNGQFGANGPISVGVAQATKGDITISLNALGTVTPLATVTVHPQITGPLTKIAFTEGQMVKAGDLLAEIDPRPYQAALDQAQGQMARDQAAIANAQVDEKRYETLLQQNSVSQQQYDTQAALVRQDQGVVKSDQANVDAARINLSYCRITSPVAGRLGLRQVDIGNLVQAGSTTIVVVTQLQPISVLFSVPEDSIDSILGQVNNGANLPAHAFDRAATKQLAEGMLATIDNQIDTTTGTVKLRAMFDNQNSELFPNQFVNVKLDVNTMRDQVIVPVAAVQRSTSGTFVFIVNADKTVHMQPVTLGPVDGEKQAVAKGVEIGNTVVIDGADRLRDGAKVSIPAQTAAGAVATAGQRPAGANGRRGQGGGRRRNNGNAANGGSTGNTGNANTGNAGGGNGGQ